MQRKIGLAVNQLSKFISYEFKPDCYWSGVVWGGTEKQPYPSEAVDKIREQIISLYQSPYVKAIDK